MIRVLPSVLFILAVALLTGCGSDPEASSDAPFATITDGLNRTVVVEHLPSRVVSIAPGATHVVRAAGGLESLVAVTTADYEDDDLSHLPRVSALPLDLEAIVALNPDLILASDQVNDPAHADLFAALGIPIVYLGSDSWEDVRESILQTGDLLGTGGSAAATADSLQASKDALTAITGSVVDPPTAIFLVSSIRSYSFGKGSYVLDLMRWAGLHPLTDAFDTPAPVLDDEWVLLNNPDFIVGAFGGGNVVEELLSNHPTWQTLDAIRERRIIDVPVPLILTPGPDNLRAAWYMARTAHPALFEPDTVAAR